MRMESGKVEEYGYLLVRYNLKFSVKLKGPSGLGELKLWETSFLTLSNNDRTRHVFHRRSW